MTHTDQTGDLPAAGVSPDTPVEIITFGYVYGRPPDADLTLDLRNLSSALGSRPSNPDAAPVVRVLTIPGIPALVFATAAAVHAYVSGPTDETVTVAIGSVDGRHRAPVFGQELVRVLGEYSIVATLTHRDLDKPFALAPPPVDRGGSHR